MEIDLSRLDGRTRKRVDEIFKGDHELKVLQAIRRQTRLAARNCQGERSVAGRGARTLEVDAVIDALWRQVYGHDYSEDQDLMKFLRKRNPEIVVRAGGTRIQVGYSAGSGSRRPVGKWHAVEWHAVERVQVLEVLPQPEETPRLNIQAPEKVQAANVKPELAGAAEQPKTEPAEAGVPSVEAAVPSPEAGQG